jgi:hypothetical protein
MTVTELLLLRGGFAPRQLGLPDDVLDPKAPPVLPLHAKIDRFPGPCMYSHWMAQSARDREEYARKKEGPMASRAPRKIRR